MATPASGQDRHADKGLPVLRYRHSVGKSKKAGSKKADTKRSGPKMVGSRAVDAPKTGSTKAGSKKLKVKKPKSKCCVKKPRCTRCPIRMMIEGTLPDGYTVRHRRLVKA